MKRLLLLSLIGLTLPAHATDWAMQLYYGVNAKQTGLVVSKRLTTFTNVLGKNSLDLDGFAGTFADGSPVGGISLGKRIKLADQADAYLGLGFSVNQNRPTDFGPCLGITVRF